MIEKLQGTFQVMEMIAFQEWQKASPERREQITKELGQLEGKMLIDAIEKEANANS